MPLGFASVANGECATAPKAPLAGSMPNAVTVPAVFALLTT
jgi:hypothetical protein